MVTALNRHVPRRPLALVRIDPAASHITAPCGSKTSKRALTLRPLCMVAATRACGRCGRLSGAEASQRAAPAWTASRQAAARSAALTTQALRSMLPRYKPSVPLTLSNAPRARCRAAAGAGSRRARGGGRSGRGVTILVATELCMYTSGQWWTAEPGLVDRGLHG